MRDFALRGERAGGRGGPPLPALDGCRGLCRQARSFSGTDKQILMEAGAGCSGKKRADHSNFARRNHCTDLGRAFHVMGVRGADSIGNEATRRSFLVSAPGDVWFLCIAAKELAPQGEIFYRCSIDAPSSVICFANATFPPRGRLFYKYLRASARNKNKQKKVVIP